MLGVQRTSVTVVAHTLQSAGLVKYARGGNPDPGCGSTARWRQAGVKKGAMSGTPHCGVRLAFLIGEPISKAFLSFECYRSAEEPIKNHKCKPSEAVMDGSRSERARARAEHLLAEIAPLPDDSELQRLRELSLDYIREAEQLEGKPVTALEASEQISDALDAIARDFFARAFQNKSKR